MRNSPEYNSAYYGRNKEKRIASIKARQKAIRDKIQELKLKTGCQLCGYSRCAGALQYHHPDKNKEFNIASMTGKGRALPSILKEVSKCVLVCANCHAEIHNDYSRFVQWQDLRL